MNYYELCKDYLINEVGVSEETLKSYEKDWETQHEFVKQEVCTIDDVLKRALHHARWGSSWIMSFYNYEKEYCFSGKPRNNIKKDYSALYDFDVKILAKQDPEKLYEKASEYYNEKKNPFRNFIRNTVELSKILVQFNDAKEFFEYVDNSIKDDNINDKLNLINELCVFNFKTAKATDFIKECGYKGFVKPDRFVLAIFPRLKDLTDLYNSIRNSGYGNKEQKVFVSLLKYCDIHGITPYEFDKILYLVVGRQFYKSGKRINTSSEKNIQDFLAFCNRKGYGDKIIL